MRQIKFRAWNKIHKEMLTKEWPMTSQFESETKEHIFMQFTGLLDKNGKEIFEGDWVRTSNCYDSKEFEGEVVWDKDGWGIKQSKEEYMPSLGHIDIEFIEIIGNHFENPELLNPPQGK